MEVGVFFLDFVLYFVGLVVSMLFFIWGLLDGIFYFGVVRG